MLISTVSTTPSSVVAGEDITVSFEATSPPSEDRTAQFNLLIDGTQQKSITKTIPAGETVTESFTYTTSSSGANAEATISTSEVTSSPITIRKYEKIIQGSSKSNLSEDVPINLKLSYGTQLTESLTDKDPESSRFGATYDPNYSYEYDAYTFDGNSGDTVTITMTKQSTSTSLILLDSSGSQVAANTNADDTSDLTDSEDSRIKDYTLQQNGEYIIIATTEYGFYIDDYSLELQKN